MYRPVRFAYLLILFAAIAAVQTISGDLVVNVANSKLALTETAPNVKLELVTETLLF